MQASCVRRCAVPRAGPGVSWPPAPKLTRARCSPLEPPPSSANEEPKLRPAARPGVQKERAENGLQEQVGKVSAFLTPQVAGDTADWFWMVLSTLVFMLLAAQLYKIYVFVAFPHLMHFHH